MENEIQVEPFKIIGISVRTTNENGKSAIDLGKLWEKFYAEDIFSKIPGKPGNDIYSIYTDYKSDYTEEYTTIIGCKVEALDNIPVGLTGKEFTGGRYIVYRAQGKMPDAVISKWQEIWSKDKELNRKYTADFEVYREQSHDPKNATVEIFIAIN